MANIVLGRTKEKGERRNNKERREKREGARSFLLSSPFFPSLDPLPLRKKKPSYPNYLHEWIVAAFEELNTHVLQHQPTSTNR